MVGTDCLSWKTSKIKSSLWVQAQVKLCDLNFIPIVVRQKGDPDSGAIILRLDRGEMGCCILSQVRDFDGNPCWTYCCGDGIISYDEAEICIKRQIKRDPDLWVIEVEDSKEHFRLDGDII